MSSNEDFTQIAEDILREMNEQMHVAQHESKGDLDMEFAQQMAAHHQGGIDLTHALSHFRAGQDSALRNLTSDVVTTQADEILRMKASVWESEPAVFSEPQIREYRASSAGIMEKMDRTMTNASPPPLSVPHQYVTMMIPHHRGGIEMARNYLRFSRNGELENLARAVIAEQGHEIRMMKIWLQEHQEKK